MALSFDSLCHDLQHSMFYDAYHGKLRRLVDCPIAECHSCGASIAGSLGQSYDFCWYLNDLLPGSSVSLLVVAYLRMLRRRLCRSPTPPAAG